MTKEEWKRVEEALTHFFHPVDLKADGYDVTLILERVGAYQNKIMVYIGGEFRGQWMAEDCEERRRFLQEQEAQHLVRVNRGLSLKNCPSGCRRSCARNTLCNIPALLLSGHPFGR